MKRKLVKVLITVVIAALLIGGGVYAYNLIWSGTASITIVSPTPGPEFPLEVVSVRPTAGAFDDGVWTLTLKRGQHAILYVDIKNPRSDVAVVQVTVNGEWGEQQVYLAPGVRIAFAIGPESTKAIPAGETETVFWIVYAEATAESGTLSDVTLEIREKE